MAGQHIGRHREQDAGAAAELASGGSVFPIPWNTLELTNTTPLATKVQLMMRRYSAP